MKMVKRYLIILYILFFSIINANPLQHGKYYQKDMNIKIQDYYVSEKLDGYRGYWDGKVLRSKTGYRYHPPLWFIKGLGEKALDGELWIDHGVFDELGGILNSIDRQDDWHKINYMIFDMPAEDAVFSERVQYMENYVADLKLPHVKIIPQVQVKNKEELQSLLDDVIKDGGEGLMLHHKDARYGRGRVNHLLKVKSYDEEKGIVIGYNEGKGKYQGKVGSLVIKVDETLIINVGSGLTDQLRNNPPAIGSTIAFIYNGLTKHGRPRFARFKRIRNSEIE